jgi:DNA-binding response OmpR family regulator
MLPNVNGFDAMRMARSQFPYLPIIAISALEEGAWRDKAFEAGASCYLQKPLRLERLLEEIALIEASRVHLTVAIVDSDPTHAQHAAQELAALGCDVRGYRTLHEFHGDAEHRERSSVVLLEAALDGLQAELEWAKPREVAAVPFGPLPAGIDDDQLMRWGASFCQLKPIDTQALVTQARCFVSPAAGP